MSNRWNRLIPAFVLVSVIGAVLFARDDRPPAPKVRDVPHEQGGKNQLTPEQFRKETASDDDPDEERPPAAPGKGVLVGERGARRLPQFSRPGFPPPKAGPSAKTAPAAPFLSGDSALLDRVRRTADAADAPTFEEARAAAADDGAAFQITLKNAFVERYKNRVTVRTQYRVVFASKVHAQADDGEIHIAGLTDDVGLACVAEIMQARDEGDAVAAVRAAAESGDQVDVTGAWRLWCEHPGKRPQIQDDVIPEYVHSNPDHVFEIHPVSRFGTHDVRPTFHPIPGYEPKEAKRAFKYYDSIPCHIYPDPANQTTTLFTAEAKFNFAEFILRVEDDEQFLTPDGRIVRCSVLDLGRQPVAKHKVRMVFVRDTPPEKAIRSLGKGSELHVVGIPRVDLALVSWRVRNASTDQKPLHWNLPYEMIVVGVYDD